MKTILTILVILFITYTGLAQIAPDKYFVQFTDKNNSPYTISNPSEFLTQRALDRRDRFDIPISMNDIPVNPSYLQGVADVGVELRNPSRWLNGVTIFTTNDSLLTVIESLPYVSNTLKIGSTKSSNSSKFNNLVRDEPIRNEGLKSTRTMDYGLSYGQIDQLNGIDLHDKGYKGEGMVIAVLDAGFTGVLEHPVFEYLRNNNKILGTKDFVYKDGDVYVGHEHGSMVLSCMAAYLPEEMIGTSPEADYWLLRSEEAPLENIIEEYNWVSAAEFADSVGADVINSSLSYFDFDMPEWSYDYSEMDGNTAISTIGADIASSKGMIVCNSAGN